MYLCLLHITEKSKKEERNMVFGLGKEQREEGGFFNEEKRKEERNLWFKYYAAQDKPFKEKERF